MARIRIHAKSNLVSENFYNIPEQELFGILKSGNCEEQVKKLNAQ